MEKFKKNLPVILLSVSCTLLLVAVILLINGNRFSFNNKTEKDDVNKENTKITDVKKNDDNKSDSNEVVNTKEESVNSNSSNVNTNSNNNSSNETKQTNQSIPSNNKNVDNNSNVPKENDVKVTNEESLLTYFQNEANSFNNANTNDTTISQKLKNSFISVVDFIFYDKEIKGYTFNGLTNSAKLKIISLALKIDNKIDSYFPGYKDTISEKYRNTKEKLAELYATYTVKLCDTVGEDTCNQFKEDYANMKKSFGITGDYLSDVWVNATAKLKDWYENWSNK